MTNRLAACFLTLLVALSGCSTPSDDTDTRPIASVPEEDPELHVVRGEAEITAVMAHTDRILPLAYAPFVNDNCVRVMGVHESNATKVVATFNPGTGAPDIQGDWALTIDFYNIQSDWEVVATGATPLRLELNTTDIPFEEDAYLGVFVTMTRDQPSAKLDFGGTLSIEILTQYPEKIDMGTDNRTSCF